MIARRFDSPSLPKGRRAESRLARSARAIPVAAALLLAPTMAFAQSFEPLPDDPVETTSPWIPGLRLGLGPAVTSQPDDPAAGPSLLSGSAFTGLLFRGAGVLRYQFTPLVALRFEAGITAGTLTGFAETDAWRRELRFSLTTLDVPLAVELGGHLGPVHLSGLAGFGIRTGLGVNGRDIRSADAPDEPVIEVRAGTAVGFLAGVGVALDVGRVRVPIEVRYQRSLNYPGTTSDRYADSTAQSPGRYWIDPTWTLVVSTGIDLEFGRRERRPSDPIQQPTYVAPPVAPPPVQVLPDHDADGIPDLTDACPIEPSDPLLGSSTAGCPEGSGIVNLSCETITLSMPIEFVTGSAQLDEMSYPVLYLVADTMNVAQNVRLVSIEGHTDDRGNDAANLRLSEERAYSVLDFLVSAGVDPVRLQAVGYGETLPIGENDTPEGRAINRRVELRILSNDTCGF
jgi:outer membrane protein OmpA-like peptidoglycan-associated protein